MEDEADNMEQILDEYAASKGKTYAELTPDERKALYREYTLEYEGISGDIDQAQAMFDKPLSEGRDVGKLYFSASPLEGLANAAQKGAGAYNRKKGRDKQEALLKQSAQARELAGGMADRANQDAMANQNAMMDKIIGVMGGGTKLPPPTAPTAPQNTGAGGSPMGNAPIQPQPPQGGPTAAPQPPQGIGIPYRDGMVPSAPVSAAGGPRMPTSKEGVPKNQEEWLAYMLRQSGA